MSYSILTLLTRNLTDVFGENDSARRRAAIKEIFANDCVFYEPGGIHRGRDEIDRVAVELRAAHPDFRYQPIAPPEELGNGGRLQWVEGPPDEAPVYAGTDFIIARDGRIAAVYLFFDKLPYPAIRTNRFCHFLYSSSKEERCRQNSFQQESNFHGGQASFNPTTVNN